MIPSPTAQLRQAIRIDRTVARVLADQWWFLASHAETCSTRSSDTGRLPMCVQKDWRYTRRVRNVLAAIAWQWPMKRSASVRKDSRDVVTGAVSGRARSS